jgi:hypothetical protein
MPNVIVERTQSNEKTSSKKYQKHDYLIAALVGYFNQDKDAGTLKIYDRSGRATNSDYVSSIPDLDPTLLKAIAMQETHVGKKDDILQCNNLGDWDPVKIKYGLVKGESPSVALSLNVGIRYLVTKGTKNSVKNGSLSFSFRGWFNAIDAWNGGGTKGYSKFVQKMVDESVTPKKGDY